MAQVTPNLGLTVWNSITDPYDSAQLAQNFVAIDQHDHSGNGKGKQIDANNAILNGSIVSAKLASPSVNSGNIYNAAITAEKIADEAITAAQIADQTITNSKILDGTITKGKLDPNTVNVPLVYHSSANGHLPSVTQEGNALYDGYTIDYAFSLTNTDYDYSVAVSSSARDYIWRLRYNAIAGDWDHIGGPMIELGTNTDINATGNGPDAGDWYSGWGGHNFLNFAVPLKGTYAISAYATMSTAGGNGHVAIALHKGATFSHTNTGVALDGTIGYGYSLDATPFSGDDSGWLATVQSGPAKISFTSNTSSGNVIRSIFGAMHKENALDDCHIVDHKLVITPVQNLKNF